MSSLLLLCTFGVSLLAMLGLWRRTEPLVRHFYAWVPVPALALGVLSVHSNQSLGEFPELLLGTRIGLDDLGRAFLILSASVWLIAGLYSRSYFSSSEKGPLFRFSFLVTYSGATGLSIAQDAPSFYAGYALMTLGGYGLIVNARTTAALVAGRVYLIVSLIGEMLALAGIIIAASGAKSYSIAEIAESVRTTGADTWSFWLIFVGFGTKVGLVPLHFWLPRSYYWASLPGVALLSGAMTKAGVLGWIRFLSGYESDLASMIIGALGALMAFYGVFFGLFQTRAKTTLAFSSLSQMGYLTIGFATLLEQGAPVATSVAVITGFAFHHGLTKVALFLGLGILASVQRATKAYWFVFAGLIVCALSLVGVPFSMGAFAKALLKDAGSTGGIWKSVSSFVMTLGAAGTALIMLRFIVLCFRGERDRVQPSRAWAVWAVPLLFVLFGAWFLPFVLTVLGLGKHEPLSAVESLKSFLPVAVSSLVAAALTFKIWTREANMSPRPFDTILQGVYKTVWEDFPKELDRLIGFLDQRITRFLSSLHLERNVQRAVTIARGLETNWLMGCVFIMAVGVLVWSFLAGGRA